MKRIEAVVRRTDLKSFYQCAGKLGILGFDLSENQNPRRSISGGRILSDTEMKEEALPCLKVNFAVLDDEAKDTVHAVLEEVHPNSIAIFQLK